MIKTVCYPVFKNGSCSNSDRDEKDSSSFMNSGMIKKRFKSHLIERMPGGKYRCCKYCREHTNQTSKHWNSLSSTIRVFFLQTMWKIPHKCSTELNSLNIRCVPTLNWLDISIRKESTSVDILIVESYLILRYLFRKERIATEHWKNNFWAIYSVYHIALQTGCTVKLTGHLFLIFQCVCTKTVIFNDDTSARSLLHSLRNTHKINERMNYTFLFTFIRLITKPNIY